MQHVFLQQHQVVLAYHRRDTPLMRRMLADLRCHGIQAWVGDYLKPETDYWTGSFQQAIRQSQAVILLLTPRAKYAPEIRLAIQTARRLGVNLYAVLLQGTPEDALPEGINDYWDVRNAVSFNRSLAIPELVNALARQPSPKPLHLRPWNPYHQTRLLLATFWKPRRIVQYQEQVGTPLTRQTAGWLAASLVFLIVLFQIIDDLTSGRWWRFLLGGAAWVGWWAVFGWDSGKGSTGLNYHLSAILTLVVLLFGLPLLMLLWNDLRAIPPTRVSLWFLTVAFLTIGSIALSLVETFQTRMRLVPVVTVLSAMTMAVSTVATLAAPIAKGVASRAGTISLLTLVGATVGGMTIAVLYGLTFWITNDLVKAIYSRGTPSRLGQAMPLVLVLVYGLLVIANIFQL